MVYALLCRYALPAWGATLAATPVLLDPSQLLAEQLILADLLAMTLMIAGLTVLLTVLLARRTSSPAAGVTAGLLVGASATVRPTTWPLILLVPACLLMHEAGWRRIAGWLRGGAALAAGLTPVLAYLAWLAAVHGVFDLTNSDASSCGRRSRGR